MKAFKKNQEATLIGNWDGQGTMFYRDVVVYSCGKKQMVLTCAITGEELGRNFKPEVGKVEEASYYWNGCFPRMTEEDAIATCLEAAEIYLAKETADRTRRLNQDSSEHSVKFWTKEIAKLHEPRAHKRVADTHWNERR